MTPIDKRSRSLTPELRVPWSAELKAKMLGIPKPSRFQRRFHHMQEWSLACAREEAEEAWRAGLTDTLRFKQTVWKMMRPGCKATPFDEALRRPQNEIEEPEPEPTPEKAGFIYFVRCNDHVKIGFASDIAARLSGMQVGTPYPLELLASTPGTPSGEVAMHARFAALRDRGEWFRYEGALAEFVESLRTSEVT